MERKKVADTFLLPVMVNGKADVIRLQREVESVSDFLRQAKVRKSGESLSLPRSSKLLETTAQANNLNLLNDQDRQHLIDGLKSMLERAPVVHISFASTPSPKFLERIVAWFRQEIEPTVLVEVGLQPSIAAGCTIRTSNKYFDLSLRRHIADNQEMLLANLREVGRERQ